MLEFSFSIPQDVIAGKGSLARLPGIAKKMGGSHGFIISGPHLNQMGKVCLPAPCLRELRSPGQDLEMYTP